jgi:hypothetical protein
MCDGSPDGSTPLPRPYTASVLTLDGMHSRRVGDYADLGDAMKAAEDVCAATEGATGWRIRYYPCGEVVLQREVRLQLPGRVFT